MMSDEVELAALLVELDRVDQALNFEPPRFPWIKETVPGTPMPPPVFTNPSELNEDDIS